MKAMQLVEQKPVEELPLELVDIPVQAPGSGQVRVCVNVCGVCHTDLHTVEGDIKPSQLPIIPGHQVVGRVDAIGDGVSNLEIGMRVGIPWFQSSCGTCQYCQSDMENLCPNAKFTGFHGNGGFAEYIVADAWGILPLSEQIEDCHAAPLLCAGIIGYRSLKKADLMPGERLGLFGFGASAHLALQVAKYWDCEVFVFTRSQNHREHARNLGASWVGGADDEPPTYLDRAIIFAPVGEIVPKALAKLRPGGTLAINAIHMSPIPELSYKLIYGERTMRSVANATRQDGIEFLKLAVDIKLKSTYKPYKLQQANQALIDLKYSKLNGEAVLVISE